MLSSYTVLDLADERGILCGFVFAELGADVICVEPPGGSRARDCGPFADGTPEPERSLFWWAYARGKRSLVLDLEAEAGRAQLRELAAKADVLIESQTPGEMAKLGLDYETLSEPNPGLVYVSVSAFGQDGPKARWAGTDLTVLAAGGPLWLQGDNDRAPVRISVPQAFAHAGTDAATAALIALHERNRSGRGQHIDVSAQQAVTLSTQSDIVADPLGETMGSRYAGGVQVGPMVVRLVFPARDGHVSITYVFGSAIGPATNRLMAAVCEDGFCTEEMRDKDWIGFTDLFLQGKETLETFEEAKRCVANWTASKTKSELLQIALDRDLVIAPVSTTQEVIDSPQLAARNYFQALDRPDGAGRARQLGPFVRFSAVPALPPARAPRIGEHTEEIVREFASRAAASPASVPVAREERGGAGGDASLPLAGVKVLDFMWAIAGPISTRIFADYGATVIRVESTTKPDACRTMRPFAGAPGEESSALFHNCNASKRMITLDLTRPESREVVFDLVRWADVVCESFTPGTMKKLGFDYESLREVKPDLIMLSTCLMGQTGPLATFAGYGNLAAAMMGFFEYTGWPDRAPAGAYGAYTDYIAPKFNASAMLTALEHRRTSGIGQHIDLSQGEAALHFLAPAMLDALVNGRVTTRVGNEDDRFAPHGCYPCAGEDTWIAIAVEDDAAWGSLCELIPQLAGDPRFAEVADRRANADALDRLIGAFTSKQQAKALEAELQEHGIAAHQVQDGAACSADPQLAARGHFIEIGNDDERTLVESCRSKLSRTPARVLPGRPTLGRDSNEVLEEVLGYEGERIVELVIAGVLG